MGAEAKHQMTDAEALTGAEVFGDLLRCRQGAEVDGGKTKTHTPPPLLNRTTQH